MITLKDLQEYGSVFNAIQFAQNTNIAYPARVTKPILKNSNDVEKLMAHVEALKQYEIDKMVFDTELDCYNNVRIHNNTIVEEYIKDESGLNNIPEQYQEKVFNKAWSDGHSDGYYSVYQELCNLVDIFN
jgi:Zn-dependent oligopeptidase